MINLKAIKERCEKATPGPWRMDPLHHHSKNQPIESENAQAQILIEGNKLISSIHITAWKQGQRDARPDARFIAASRTDLPQLVDWVEKAYELLSEIEDNGCVRIGRIELIQELLSQIQGWAERHHVPSEVADD